MWIFRSMLILFFVAIAGYTMYTAANHGWDLFEVFLGNIKSGSWSGQFNLDFALYLFLSAIWIAWRHKFAPLALLIALAASILGMAFFAPYLLIISFQAKGDLKKILLGEN